MALFRDDQLKQIYSSVSMTDQIFWIEGHAAISSILTSRKHLISLSELNIFARTQYLQSFYRNDIQTVCGGNPPLKALFREQNP
ncbi:hypothetical protein Y032_0172g372 [Ancylostoma ceylanicum]|uniref:Uncharacterized protein n=1 Tax=Ancylostoma ceylanicum TaxID=53326 RepID=A0A016SUJ1_9BILA|nr:hypothetical protein Y032_0172g372 [Ancylostoma ceylanicum]